jgi:hypothetical protein
MSQEFYELFLKPCLDCPKKYLEFRSEIDEEWSELRRYHITELSCDPEKYKEERKWIILCMTTLRVLRR